MVSQNEAKRVGEVNFLDYKTEFLVMPTIKKYLEQHNISLSALLPDGCLWYEGNLFALNDDDEDMDFGKNFRVIYTGIFNDFEEGIHEKPEDVDEIILESDTKIKDFTVKYMILGK